jgi:hypothetical protein
VVELNRPVINVLATEEMMKPLMPININKLQINNGRFAYIDLNKNALPTFILIKCS